MIRNFFSTAILMLLFAGLSFGQSGKIHGRIVDRETNQPLIGANVLVVGTSFGASTDINGEYIISNLSPGKYILKATFLGYQNVILENIDIVSGLTAEADFKLPVKSVETQTVVVVSKRPLIQKSATNAVRIISPEDLETLPVRSVNNIIALQAGVVQQNGEIYIRGSRSDETGYMVEGVSTTNIPGFSGGNLVSIIPDAVAEVLVQAGGFSAEYGNANGGIVSEDFKTGTDKYHLSFRAETDNFGNYPGHKFLGTYSYGYTDYTATISGPILSNKIKIFLAGENKFNRDSNPMFISGNPKAFSDGALFDTTRVYASSLGGGNPNDSYILTWPGGNILGQMTNQYLANGTISFDLKPLLLRISGSFSKSISRIHGNFIISNFDLVRLPYNKTSNVFLNLKGTYLLATNSFIEVNVNYTDDRNKDYDQLWGDNYLLYGDSLANAHAGYPGFRFFTTSAATDYVYGFPFHPYGQPLAGYDFHKWTNIGGSVAYTAQLGKHELKAGGEIQSWTIRRYFVGGSGAILDASLLNPDYARNPAAWKLLLQFQNYRSFVNSFGYDFYGNEVNSGPFADHKPIIGGVYIQDKLEINDLIISAGLRFDYFDMDAWKLKDPANPTYSLNTHLVPDSNFVPGTRFKYVSPHLGFSFPVTDRTVFHFQFGKYVQAPALGRLYTSPLSLASQLIGGFAGGAAAFDPEPVRTTQYEVGFTQQFTDFAAFDITAYYKDITGQLQYSLQYTAPGSRVSNYATYVNQDFATSKGIELSLRIRRINRIRAQINYTFSNVKGTNSFPISALGSVQTGNASPTVIQPLDYNQTHRGSIIIDYRFGKDDGGPILQQLGLNLLFTFNSGHPYTPANFPGLGQTSAWTGGITTDTRSRRPAGPVNSATTPWIYDLDFRIDKTLRMFNKLNANFYVYVSNVLNTKNIINVYNATGNAYDDGFLNTQDAIKLVSPDNATYGPRFADLYNALNLGNRQANIEQLGYDLFGVPRQLRVGVEINY